MSVMIPVGILDATDHIIPAGGFTSPAAGATVGGVITLAVNVSDNDSVASVQFLIDGNNLGTVGGPFQMNYDTRGAGNGGHTFTAIVKDRVGNQRVLTQSVTINNAPLISITSPGYQQTVGGTITLAASPTSYGGAPSVYFNIDGTNVSGWMGAPYNMAYDTHNLGVGWHTLYAYVQDPQGNFVGTSLPFYVSNGIGGGLLYFGEWTVWDDGQGGYTNYYGRTVGPDYNNRWGVNSIWNNYGTRIYQYIGLPGNPDPAHYQMVVQLGTTNAGRVEGGSDGNVIHVWMDVNGTEYDTWDNGPCWGPWRSGPQVNVNGGEGVRVCRFDNSPGWNTCFIQGICVYYDFIPRYAS